MVLVVFVLIYVQIANARATNDNVTVEIKLSKIPYELIFDQKFIPNNKLEYGWGCFIDIDGNPNTGSIYPVRGCEVCISLSHFKRFDHPQHNDTILNGTQHNTWIFNESSRCWDYGHDINVSIDYTNSTITIIASKDWEVLRNLSSNSRFCLLAYYYPPMGKIIDKTDFAYVGETITDPAGDVNYSFVDIVGGTLKLPLNVDKWQKYDVNDNGEIDDIELIIAIQDWLNGKISDLNLIEVIQMWLR